MPSRDFYFLTGPTEWASPPTVYSYTSLKQIESCPFSWQLQNSKYDGFDRFPLRLISAGVEGEIVHKVLEKLFKSLATFGMPQINTDQFKKCISEISINQQIIELIKEHASKVANHPRASGFRLKSSAQQLQNKVIRIFREQYEKIRTNTPSYILRPWISSLDQLSRKHLADNDYLKMLKEKGILSELSIKHTVLPYKGIIDFICMDDDGVIISDFKSGESKPDHRDQVLVYALLWANNTGKIPDKAFVIYTDKSLKIDITEKEIEDLENDLKQRIDKANGILSVAPSQAYLHEGCVYCHVRQFCSPYWDSLTSSRGGLGFCDVEICIEDIPSEYGLVGRTESGDKVNIVHDKDVPRVFGPFKSGDRLRILNGMRQADSIEINSWSEIFHK